MARSSDNSLGKNRTLIITLAIVLILLVNSVSLYNNIRRSQNSVNDTFRTISTTQLQGITFKYPNNEPSASFDVFNNSIFAIDNNIIIEYTFDESFNTLISDNSYQLELPFSTYVGKGPVKFTTNGNQSLLLQHQLVTLFKSQPEYVLQPKIFELGKLYTNNFTTFQSILNITCTIPNYYKTVMYADTCYSRDIEFLNSTVLLVLQDYANHHNIDYNEMLINKGASLLLYDIQQNRTMKTIELQNADTMDYSYVYAPKNTNEVLIYYSNKVTYDQGYMSVNLDNYNIKQLFGNNLKNLIGINHPLLINSKFLVFNYASYSWYLIQPERLGMVLNIILYFGIIVPVLIISREKWVPRLKKSINYFNQRKYNK